MLRRSLFAAAAVAVIALPAWAQAPAQNGTPARVRGTVEKLDGHTLVVKSREGGTVSIALSPDVKVAVLVKKSLADIKPNDYVAVRILPEAMRGVGEGQRPWDLKPGSLMTNATVTGTAKVEGGELLKVKYKDGESDYVVGPECPVLGMADGDTGLLKPGAAVFVIAQKHPDGSLTSARLYAEKDGVKPPM